MKTLIIYSTLLIISVILLINCSSSINDTPVFVNNKYLNYLPSIAKKYTRTCKEKEKELNNCVEINEAYRLDKELKLLEREWGTKISESNKTNPFTTALPFKTLPSINYTINQITVIRDKVYKTCIIIKFDITITKDIKNAYDGFQKNLFIYYKTVDNKGKEIPKTTSIATNYNRDNLKSGFTFSILGQLGPLAQLENFAKINLVTQEEYNNKKYKNIAP